MEEPFFDFVQNAEIDQVLDEELNNQHQSLLLVILVHQVQLRNSILQEHTQIDHQVCLAIDGSPLLLRSPQHPARVLRVGCLHKILNGLNLHRILFLEVLLHQSESALHIQVVDLHLGEQIHTVLISLEGKMEEVLHRYSISTHADLHQYLHTRGKGLEILVGKDQLDIEYLFRERNFGHR